MPTLRVCPFALAQCAYATLLTMNTVDRTSLDGAGSPATLEATAYALSALSVLRKSRTAGEQFVNKYARDQTAPVPAAAPDELID